MPLNPRAINQLFNLLNDNSDDYSAFFSNNTDEMSDSLVRAVTIFGTQWTRSENGILTCPRDHLTTEAKVWFYFIRHSLMLTGHTSTLNMERVFLLASIVNDRSINVGKIICEQIRVCVNKKSGEIFFPTLI